MPWAWLGRWIVPWFAYAFVRVIIGILTAFGISWAVYEGVDQLFTNLESFIMAHYNGLGGTVAQVAVLINVPQCLNILFSAFSARITLKTVNGALSRFVAKPTAP